MVLVRKEVKGVYVWDPNDNTKYIQIRPVVLPYLCFTANTANSTVQLTKNGSPTAVSLETSTDGNTWTDYTVWTTINLSTVWSKVYMRNKSETQTTFSTSSSNYYKFVMSWNISASWDITYLLKKDWTITLSGNYVFFDLFHLCTSLITPPELPATTLVEQAYRQMFNWCTGLVTAPSLPATTLKTRCYYAMFQSCSNLEQIPEIHWLMNVDQCCRYMFQKCSKIKISATQTWEYQTPYVITWSWTQIQYMFAWTWWTYTDVATVAWTYYTSNTLV